MKPATQQPRLISWQTIEDIPTLSATDLHVWQIDLARYPGHPDVLDNAERTRWQTMQDPGAAQRFCATRSALRHLLGAYLDCAPAAVSIQLGLHGKPELASPTRPLFFNLSHTGDTAVVACHTGSPVGIDIEQFRPSSGPVRSIAERVFNSAYIATLQAADYDPAVFLRLWVQWEAQQKCLGLGLLMRDNDPPPLGFFAGEWRLGQLCVAWIRTNHQPTIKFFTLMPSS